MEEHSTMNAGPRSQGSATAAVEAAAGGTWDVEEDHMLSFFILSGTEDKREDRRQNMHSQSVNQDSPQQQPAGASPQTQTHTDNDTPLNTTRSVAWAPMEGDPDYNPVVALSPSRTYSDGGLVGGIRRAGSWTKSSATRDHNENPPSPSRQLLMAPLYLADLQSQQQQQQQQGEELPPTPRMTFFSSGSSSSSRGASSSSKRNISTEQQQPQHQQQQQRHQLPQQMYHPALNPQFAQNMFPSCGGLSTERNGSTNNNDASISRHSAPMPRRIDSYSSSSSSSLSSMAAAMGQGPASVLQLHRELQSKEQLPTPPPHASPISPAAMIGMTHAHETMMLPPPPRTRGPTAKTSHSHSGNTNDNDNSNSSHMSSSTASSKTQQQQHLEWIHSMNAMAMMANPFDAHQQQQLQGYMHPRTYTASPSGQQQMAHTIHPPQQTYMGPGFTTHMSLSSQPSSHSHSHPQHQQQQTRNDNSGNQKAPSTNNNMDHLMPSAEIASAILMNAHPPNRGGYRMIQTPVVETAEKKARRLARNRESARQSRRRKKELLSSLSDKVNKLHHAIEVERQNQLRSMEKGLRSHRQALIQQLNDTQSTTTQSYTQKPHSEALRTIVHDMGPNSTVRRSAAAFQYSALKQCILPKYQEYLLWLTQNDTSYLTAAKDERTKGSKMSARVSSKQIGEDLSNAWKTETKTGSCDQDGNQTNTLTCETSQATKFWPLLAYELSLSVDQEERLLLAHKRTREHPNIKRDCAQICAASTAASNMRTAMLFQCHTSSHRNETALLHILSEKQSIAFLQWFQQNKERCQSILKKKEPSSENDGSSRDATKFKQEATSLNDICVQLNESLKRLNLTEN